ncbi:MAG TPA: DUF2127 domain-containing protein [Steroidobacteraceae bacterium]|nr:DUF2127 domain-containing protein [Steroidobacteraceae bacterium]
MSPHTRPAPVSERQRVGFKLIIAYKLCKAALMLGVALWLTLAPDAAYRAALLLVRELTEGGAAFASAGRWISDHLTGHLLVRGAELAWLDSVTSAIEGVLLLSGRLWAEWIVIVGLACLLPFEVHSILHTPRLGKLVILSANGLIVAYLAWVQIQKSRPRPP